MKQIPGNEVVSTLQDAITVINGLPSSVFKNSNVANTLTNKINAVLEQIDQGLYQSALDKLENDILNKTDGYAAQISPDKNDWITDCESQAEVYPIIMEAIELLRNMI